MSDTNDEERRIAVVGAGISGLSAAWLLHKKGGTKVTLFEKEAICGGHSFTDDSPGFPVDLGFQVYNLTTYPNFVELLENLRVDSEESEMSFSLSIDSGALEWASHSLATIFAQRGNLLKLKFWRMVWDVLRFGREAPKVLDPTNAALYGDMTLGEYLKKKRFSQAFQDNYLLPMCAAVWSVPNSKIFEFPVVMLIRFWRNHHLLDILERPVWRVVKNRSRTYVNAIVSDLEDIWINAEIKSVTPGTPLSRPAVNLASGDRHEFDAVILATHSDTSLKLLGRASPENVRETLEAIPYGVNEVWVHKDRRLMPQRRDTWASWNFIGRSDLSDDASVCVTYWLNRLQSLPANAPDIFVTLNPVTEPAEGSVIRRLDLSHPVYSLEACRAQSRVWEIQGQGGIYFAGAWCGYGFHEDGLKAGLEAAKLLGAEAPWTATPTCPKISLRDRICIAIFDRFAKLALKTGYLRLILPNGKGLSYGDAGCSRSQSPEEEWRGLPQQKATVRVFNCSFFWKIISRHDTGLGESYMDRDFEVTGDLGCLLAVITANAVNIEANRGALSCLNWLGDKLLLLSHLGRSNTISGSRRNIEQHYDAGNDMYRLFLDSSMTYSGAIHGRGRSLEDAQMHKLDSLINQARLAAGDEVLEIGCGWGSLAIRAVQKTGCKWTGVTLSKAQLAEAQQRVEAAGLEHRISLLFCDYRDLPGSGRFDKVISCEMVEAVGQEHLGAYFWAVSAALKPGGTAVLQAISEPDDRYEAYCASSDFIREHIFPGGHLPCLAAMIEAGRGAGLSMTSVSDIGRDYAVTLREWRSAWEARREEALALGYSDRFWRKYRFYFAYCEAAFDAQYIHNFQITWKKTGQTPEGLGPAASMQEAPQPGSLLSASDPADPLTQVLLAVYFFLAGIAVSQSRRLWVVPLASAIYLALLTVTTIVIAKLAHFQPKLSKLGSEARAWLSLDVVHLLHSGTTCLGAALHIWRQPQAWLIRAGGAADAQLLPHLLICISAGFFGFQLFALVHQRLFRRVRKVVLHFTILLVLFGTAAYKREHTALLACGLLSELPSVFYLLAKIQDILGQAPAKQSKKQQLLAFAELPSTLLLQVVPHAFIGASVILNADSFSNQPFYLAVVIGFVYLNVVNVRRLAGLVRAIAAGGKVHTA